MKIQERITAESIMKDGLSYQQAESLVCNIIESIDAEGLSQYDKLLYIAKSAYEYGFADGQGMKSK